MEPAPGLDPGGLFANGGRAANLVRARRLLAMPAPATVPEEINAVEASEPPSLAQPCPCRGGRMIIIETFERGAQPRAPPTSPSRIDAS